MVLDYFRWFKARPSFNFICGGNTKLVTDLKLRAKCWIGVKYHSDVTIHLSNLQCLENHKNVKLHKLCDELWSTNVTLKLVKSDFVHCFFPLSCLHMLQKFSVQKTREEKNNKVGRLSYSLSSSSSEAEANGLNIYSLYRLQMFHPLFAIQPKAWLILAINEYCRKQHITTFFFSGVYSVNELSIL